MLTPQKPRFSDHSFQCRPMLLKKVAVIIAMILFSALQMHGIASVFPPGVPDLTHPETKLIIIDDYAIGDGLHYNRIRAHIVDSDGNPVANQDVSFSWDLGSGEVGTVIKTDANGDAILVLNKPTPGPVAITAKVNGQSLIHENPKTVTFVGYNPDVSVSTTNLTVTANGAAANGMATNCVKAHVTDANGFSVPNQAVTFRIDGGTGTFTGPATVITDVNGDATICLNSTVVGSVSIKAEVNGADIITGSPAIVEFVADAPSTGVPTTFLAIVTDNAAANGSATNSVRAHITDAYGNPVANQTVTFSIISGTGAFVGSATVTTNANGDAVISLTSTVANTVTINASVNGSDITNNGPIDVHFVPDAPSGSVSTTYLQVLITGAIANGTDMNSVKAHITDANGNPVANQSVTFSISGGTANITGSATVTTDANGDAVITLSTTVAGSVSLTAIVNGINIVNGSPATVVFVADAPDIGNPATALIVVTNNAPADGNSTNSVKAHIVDANGNPVPGQTVTFTIASGTATPSGSLTVTTDANGDAFITLTSNIAGDVTITAQLNRSIDIVNGSAAAVKFLPEPDVNNPATMLMVVTDNAYADGAATNSVRAHVVDVNGDALPNQEVIFTVASGDATIITAQPVITDANGEALILLTSKTPGYVTITATVKNKPIIHGSPARVRFTPEDIWVPKVFTPNGDGTNDIVKPIVTGVFNLRFFNIYNRWGNLVFTTTDVNQGWDGKLKGVLQPNETYVWIIGGTDKDGKNVKKRGMTSLVR